MVKNLPVMQDTQFQFLGQEDLLEKDIATHSSILAWRIPWKEDKYNNYDIHSIRSKQERIMPIYCMGLLRLPYLKLSNQE